MPGRLCDRRNGLGSRGAAAIVESLLMYERELAEISRINVERTKRSIQIAMLKKPGYHRQVRTIGDAPDRCQERIAKFGLPCAGKLFEIKRHASLPNLQLVINDRTRRRDRCDIDNCHRRTADHKLVSRLRRYRHAL